MFIFEKAPFRSCHASTIAETTPENFLAAWFGGKSEGSPDVKIWTSHFKDASWSKPEVAAEEPGFPCWNPVLFHSREKVLFLFYKAGRDPMSWSGYMRRSTDGGRTWEKSEQLAAGLLGPIKNKPIQLSDGSILAGTSVESHKAWACWVERSIDEGRTWRRFGPIAVPGHPYGIIQPTLFSTKGPTILAYCRSRHLGVICRAESHDGGVQWSPARRTELLNPNSGIDGIRAKNGHFFLVYNPSRTERYPLVLARSLDHGISWKTVATLEDQIGEFSYPAIIEAHNGNLHITYTWNRRHIQHAVVNPTKLPA